MNDSFTDDDVGKSVETAAGDPVGVVDVVEGETAYVDPEPGIAESLRAALDWGDASGETLPLASAAVAEIDDERVRLGAEYSTDGDETGEMDDATSGRYRQDETDAEPGSLEESDPEPGAGRQDETDLEPDDLDETDPELDDFDGSDPGVEGDPDDPALTDASGEIDGDRERRTDPTTDPLEEAGGTGGRDADAETGSGTREDVDVDPTELLDEAGSDEREDEA